MFWRKTDAQTHLVMINILLQFLLAFSRGHLLPLIRVTCPFLAKDEDEDGDEEEEEEEEVQKEAGSLKTKADCNSERSEQASHSAREREKTLPDAQPSI